MCLAVGVVQRGVDFKAMAARAGMCPASAMLDPEIDGSGNDGAGGGDFANVDSSGGGAGRQALAFNKSLSSDLSHRFCECVCAGASVGGQSLLESLLAAPWESGIFNALVDTARGLDPGSLGRGLGEGLLWVPVGGRQPLVRALDILLRDENFGLVAADLRGLSARELGQIQPFVWYRLQRLAHQRSGGCLLLTAEASVRCADRRLRLDRPRRLEDLDRPRVEVLAELESATHEQRRGHFRAQAVG